MTETPSDSPRFGHADLTNCERELIHLAGSVQPHGMLLVVSVPSLVVEQASANVTAFLGVALEDVLQRPLAALGGDCARQVAGLIGSSDLSIPVPVQCALRDGRAGGQSLRFEGTLHNGAGGVLILELEPAPPNAGPLPTAAIARDVLMRSVSAAMQRFSAASSLGTLADAAAQCVHDLTGYDRVMVYKFDPDGHGKIIAEARDPRLEPLLGHRYPASDIPQRARELYLRMRVRVLVDVNYEPVPLVPARSPVDGRELDMSLCQLRSMSPLHLQYLKNMGVTATLVISLVREGRLWGLIAAHHYGPRHLRFDVRASCELLAEVIATRIAAIENYAHAQVAILVQRLEQRLIEATSVEGDWRLALFRNPRTLLQPLEATGAALFHDGEVLSAGEVPSTPELRALMQWIDAGNHPGPFACSAIAQADPAFGSLTPTASGVLSVKLSATRPDYLIWFRKEQLQTVTWAGDPNKPTVGDSPLELSPRRSFAAWSEIVRGTALPWTHTEVVLARAIGSALVDIILQVHAVRLLIAEHQLVGIRSVVDCSRGAVAIADASGRLLHTSPALRDLLGEDERSIASVADVAALFEAGNAVRDSLLALATVREPFRRDGLLSRAGRAAVPVGVRAEVIPASNGVLLGFVLTLADLSDSQRAADARRQLEQKLMPARQQQSDDVIRAILTNASLAAMDISDGPSGPAMAPMLCELEESTERAQALYEQIRRLDRDA
jgi:light-regulated signal transduction histidine kinase (bacteriophytochrome)